MKTVAELEREWEARMDERVRRYKSLKDTPKRELLSRLSRSMRIHALSERDGLATIKNAIVEAELPMRSLERQIQRAKNAEVK